MGSIYLLQYGDKLVEMSEQAYDSESLLAGDQINSESPRRWLLIAHSLEQLLSDLGVSKTHSRPHVSDDNPYPEAQFKTLKYRPGFPERFGSLPDGRAWVGGVPGLVQLRAPSQRFGPVDAGERALWSCASAADCAARCLVTGLWRPSGALRQASAGTREAAR